MTLTEFICACTEVNIEPSSALENEAIKGALRARNATEVKRLLLEEF